MSAIVERRNNRAYWVGRVQWSRVGARVKPACEDCVINVHENGGAGRILKARHRRRNAVDSGTFGLQAAFQAVLLCDTHKQEWLDWTPGQQVLS